MKIIAKQLVFILTLILLPVVTHAALVDQENNPAFQNATFYVSWGAEWQQEVTVGVSGQLVGIELRMSDITTSFFINTGSGWQSDTHDYVTSITGLNSNFDWLYIDLTPANLFYQTNDIFVFGSLSGWGNFPGFKGTSYDTYAEGSLFRNGDLRSGDFAFRTHVNPVPLPPTSVLMVTGILPILLFVKRNRRVRPT